MKVNKENVEMFSLALFTYKQTIFEYSTPLS